MLLFCLSFWRGRSKVRRFLLKLSRAFYLKAVALGATKEVVPQLQWEGLAVVAAAAVAAAAELENPVALQSKKKRRSAACASMRLRLQS